METTFDRYPTWIVAVSNLVSLAIYGLGGYIMAGLGVWVLGAYVAYCLWLEVRLLKSACADCAYYGRTCGTGKGRLCALLFRRGDPHRFAAREVSWLQILPDLSVSLVPLIVGIVLSILGFSWTRLVAMLGLLALSSAGNAAVRGNLLCAHCEQRSLGCPASKLFEGRT